MLTSDISEKIDLEDGNRIKQEGQRCPRRQVVQAAIRQGSTFSVVQQPESAENSTGLPLYTERLTEGLQANKIPKYVHISIYCSFNLQ